MVDLMCKIVNISVPDDNEKCRVDFSAYLQKEDVIELMRRSERGFVEFAYIELQKPLLNKV